jgi:hypothetical protein
MSELPYSFLGYRRGIREYDKISGDLVNRVVGEDAKKIRMDEPILGDMGVVELLHGKENGE